MGYTFDMSKANLEEMSEDMSVNLVKCADELKSVATAILKHYKVSDKRLKTLCNLLKEDHFTTIFNVEVGSDPKIKHYEIGIDWFVYEKTDPVITKITTEYMEIFDTIWKRVMDFSITQDVLESIQASCFTWWQEYNRDVCKTPLTYNEYTYNKYGKL